MNFSVYKRFEQIPVQGYDIAMIASELRLLKMFCTEFIRYFKLGKIYPHLWDYLGLNVPLVPDHLKIDPFNNIIPKNCEIDTKNKRLSMKTLVFDLSTRYIILHANPFTVLNETEDHFCPLEYTG